METKEQLEIQLTVALEECRHCELDARANGEYSANCGGCQTDINIGWLYHDLDTIRKR